MSSNNQDASASPEHAEQKQKVSAHQATSDAPLNNPIKLQPIAEKPKAIADASNEGNNESSPIRPVPNSEIQIITNTSKINAAKSCQSPKDANISPPSPSNTLSSHNSSNSSTNNIVSTNYQSVNSTDQSGQDEPENQNRNHNVSFSARRVHEGGSAPNSRNNSANYTNRNINDHNASFGEDHTGQAPISRYRPQKYCAVCGDKAIACNFNAVTCESCKAFFRRNAFKEQRLKCLFDGRCVVDKVTRRFCSKCRLLKCFQIGMKREWILTDEQKQIKRVKIMQNKQSKHHQQQPVSTSVLDVGSQPRSQDGSTSNASAHLTNSAEEAAKSEHLAQKEIYFKRQRTSTPPNYSNSNSNSNNLQGPQKRDASTSCPDETDLLSGQILHYCTMAHQCQYCSLRLQSTGPPLHPVEQYQTNYRFHSSHRQYFEYNQRQQQDYQQQQQQQQQQHHQHFRYGQHVSHPYVDSQASSSAYSQHQMATAAAAALKTSADAMNAAYAANIASGATSANNVTQSTVGPSQQAMSNVACAVPQAAPNCCCPSFSEIFQSQHYNRPPAPGSAATGALPIIDHFANGSPSNSSGSCGSGAQVVFPDVQPPITTAAPNTSQSPSSKSCLSGQGAGDRGAIESNPIAPSTEQALDNLETRPMAVMNGGGSARAASPLTKVVNVPSKELSTSMDLVINGNASINRKEPADSSTPGEGVLVKADETQRQTESEVSHSSATAIAIDATKLPATVKQTLTDGSPIDISKHVIWNGVVYAQPAIAESEMRARIETIDFTETERHLVYEMIDATKFMFEPTSTDRSFNDDSLDDFVYFCDAALRRLIKTVKQIRAFRILSMDDQIMLLKTACFKILLLRSCLHFHDDIEGWRDRYGRIMPLSLLKKAKSMVYDKHKEILTKLSGPLRKDRLIMGFMSLVLLFDPQDNLKHTNSVGLDNLVYMCILRKYLIGTQPDPLEKYERLVEATRVINACNEEYNVFFSCNFQPEQITPLLIEIFDISINNSV